MCAEPITLGDGKQLGLQRLAHRIRLLPGAPTRVTQHSKHGPRSIGRIHGFGQLEQPGKDQRIDARLTAWIDRRTPCIQPLEQHAPSITQWKQYDLAIV